jgi:hypothetical protein
MSMNFEINIDQKMLDRVQKNLISAVDDSVKQSDIDYVGQQILTTILMRTRRGRFFSDSGSLEKRRYKSESWKKQRRKKGLQTSHVSLFYGEGGLLEAMRVRGRAVQGDIEVEAGYIDGLSETRAREIAQYMNKDGIGVNRVRYRYIRLHGSEEERIFKALRRRMKKNIGSAGQS